MDIATLIGIFLAFGAILGGQVIEGGHLGSILQPTAAIIVLGGTLGAVAVQFPAAVLRRTILDLKSAFLPARHDLGAIVKTIVSLANKARRDGLVAIENDAGAIKDSFTRRAFELAIDGTEGKQLRAALELEIGHLEEEGEGPAKVLEAAGGYSPTVGILGAVLGLIHVMARRRHRRRLRGHGLRRRHRQPAVPADGRQAQAAPPRAHGHARGHPRGRVRHRRG